jgi:hypothetical protein
VFYFTADKEIAKEYTEKDTTSPYDKFNMVDKILDSKGNEILFDKVLLREIWESDKVAANKSRAAGKYISGPGVISDNPNYNKYFEKMLDELGNKKYSISQLLEKYQSTEINEGYGSLDRKPNSDGKTPIINSIERHYKDTKKDFNCLVNKVDSILLYSTFQSNTVQEKRKEVVAYMKGEIK